MTRRIAWIGTGLMGLPMAGRLVDAGWDVGVWNRTPEKAEPLVAAGATRLARLADAADYEIVGSMVLDDDALDALAGPDGILGDGAVADGALLDGPLADGSATRVWVDCSTVSPAAAERAAAAAAEHGVVYVAAAISGNPGTVTAGTAVFMLSGDDPSALAVAEDVLSTIGARTTRVGGGAAAKAVKLAVNALLAVTMQSLAESVLLADGLGVGRRVFLEFLADSVMGSPFVRYKVDALADLDFTRTTAPASQLKDARLALDAAAALGIPQPVLAATAREYERLAESDLAEGRDIAALLLLLARDARIELTAQPAPPVTS